MYIRSRLSELNSLITTLTEERTCLQSESDAITYPVLSLPLEITTLIFRQHILAGSQPAPTPTVGPLLVAQVCSQWREISLVTPELWSSGQFGDDSSVEIFNLWLSRAGNLPLDYSFNSHLPSWADAVIETFLPHTHHWQDCLVYAPTSLIT